jgi:hypothetical protein
MNPDNKKIQMSFLVLLCRGQEVSGSIEVLELIIWLDSYNTSKP